ncbi:MAG: tetratricopeptide repeat protein [Candidatus Hydrogenedentota bacterium]
MGMKTGTQAFPGGSWPPRRVWLVLACILAAGALVRGVYLLEIMGDPAFEHPLYDPQYNDYWARALVTGDWTPPDALNDPEIRNTPHGRPPGYPWFLAAVYYVCGLSYLAPRLVQMGLGLVNALLGFLLGRRLFGDAAGLVSAVFIACYWAFPYFEGLLTYPAVVVFLVLGVLLALHGWVASARLHWIALAGLLMGALALFRPNGLLVAALLLPWCYAVVRRCHGAGTGRFLRVAAVFILAIALPLAPPFIRNWVVAEDVVFLSSYGGLNLYVGNHPGASLVEPRIPELEPLAGISNWSCFDYPAIVRGVAVKEGKDHITYSEASAYFYAKALDFIRENPGAFLRNTGRKALLFWAPVEVTNDTVLAYDKRASPILRWLPGFAWAAGLFLVGAMGWLLHGRRNASPVQRALGVAVLVFIFGYFLSVIPFFIAGRYRMPVLPLILLFAAYTVVRVGHAVRGKHWRGAGAWCLAAVAAVAVAHINVTGYHPSKAIWHFRDGLAHAAAGEPHEALSAYRMAQAHQPDDPIIMNNLGRTLLAIGRVEEAQDILAQGLAANPGFAPLHNSLGHLYHQARDYAQAEHHFNAAIELRPRYLLAHMNLGHTLAAQNKSEAALRQFQRAAEIAPHHAEAHYNAGRMLSAFGRLDEAVAHYRAAIEQRPGFALAYNNLGYVLFQLERNREAAAALQDAVNHDPTLTVAWLNLGHVRLALSESRAAAEAYATAMKLDPNDPLPPYNLGQLFDLAGNRGRAAEYYGIALECDPSFKPAKEALDQLRAETG